jgi:hypothetical protein
VKSVAMKWKTLRPTGIPIPPVPMWFIAAINPRFIIPTKAVLLLSFVRI